MLSFDIKLNMRVIWLVMNPRLRTSLMVATLTQWWGKGKDFTRVEWMDWFEIRWCETLIVFLPFLDRCREIRITLLLHLLSGSKNQHDWGVVPLDLNTWFGCVYRLIVTITKNMTCYGTYLYTPIFFQLRAWSITYWN